MDEDALVPRGFGSANGVEMMTILRSGLHSIPMNENNSNICYA